MTDAAGLVPFDLITSLTNAYQDERRRIDLAASFLAEETGPQGVVRHFLAGNVKEDRGVVPNVATLFKLEGAVAALNSHYWQKAIELTDVLTVMPQARRDEWHEQIRISITANGSGRCIRGTSFGWRLGRSLNSGGIARGYRCARSWLAWCPSCPWPPR